MDNYTNFLESKIKLAPDAGIVICPDALHPSLLPHQVDSVMWAAKKGRALVGSSFGLGKTRTQLELLRVLLASTDAPGGRALIICPLGVKHQFVEEDGPALGLKVTYVRNDAEALASSASDLLITNYERVRDGGFSAGFLSSLTAVTLDEGSVLRSLGTKTHQTFATLLSTVPYRFVFTATPAPNQYTELLNYAQFLGVMDRGQALTRWFKRDSQKAGNLTLHAHHAADFWVWVSSWALFLTKPSDLGYSDEGYDLPGLTVHWHLVTDTETTISVDKRSGQSGVFTSTAGNLVEAAREKKRSIGARVAKALEIANKFTYIDNVNNAQLSGNENQAGAQQGLLRGQQGEAEGAQAGSLSRHQGEDRPRAEEGVHGRVSEDLRAQEVNAATAGGAQSEAPGTVCSRPGTSREATEQCQGVASEQPRQENESASEGVVRDNAGALQPTAGSPGREMCDLRDNCACQGSEPSVCGPLPQHATSAGASVPPLQLRAGALPGQSATAAQGDRLSEQFIVFCHLNEEQSATDKVFSAAGYSIASIFGSLSDEEKQRRLYTWKDKEKTMFLTKPEMYGAGVNLQQCCKMIFLGIDYRFEDFIQAVHRIYRFQQSQPVQVHILYTPAEEPIRRELEAKWARHNELQAQMQNLIRAHGLHHTRHALKLQRDLGVERTEAKGERFVFAHNDCVAETQLMETESVHLIHTSIPFGNHYEYSASYNDFGHNDDNGKFFEQMDFLVPELLRVLKPGRIAAIHVKDRIRYGSVTGNGFMTVDRFSDQTADCFERHGFVFMGRCTILTDVVRENNQTYRLGWSEQCKDGTKMSYGMPEYVLLFRKLPTDLSNAYADEPVKKDKASYSRGRWQLDAHALWRSSGNRLLTPQDIRGKDLGQIGAWWRARNLHEVYDFAEHVGVSEQLDEAGRLSSSYMMLPPQSYSDMVWTDIVSMRTLNGEQFKRNAQNHICPLPFDIVDRVIERWSNLNEVVYEPFGGIGTVPYRTLALGRRARAVELKKEYWQCGVQYCKEAEYKAAVPTLFDLMAAGGESETVKKAA